MSRHTLVKFIFVRIVFVCIGIVFAFLAGEAAVRIFDLGPKRLEPLFIPSYRLSENPILKYEYRPCYEPTDTPYDDFHTNFAINSAGFRDREFDVEKPGGTLRVIVLGDSITSGNGIENLDDTYPKKLEELLNRDSGTTRVQVYNMGVGGYCTMQEAETLRCKGLVYQPDYVLVGFCMNDFWPGSDGGVYERLLAVNTEARTPGHLVSYESGLLKYSRLAFVIHHLIKQRFGSDPPASDRSIEGGQPKKNVKQGLGLLKRLSDEHGFELLVFNIPGFNRPFEDYRFSKMFDWLKTAALEAGGVRVEDLLDDFSRRGPDADVYSLDELHPNVLGHNVLAEILHEKLMEHFAELRTPRGR